LVGYAKKVIKFLNHLIIKNAHKTDKIYLVQRNHIQSLFIQSN